MAQDPDGSAPPSGPRAESPAPAAGALPCPGVELGPDYLRRLQRLSLRFAAGLEQREGAGRAGLLGAGEEYVGSRPYRPGEDLRQLDWDLLARLDRPYIRVTRREASERWSVWIDTSASMGVGPPGKLQAAAEVAGGIASIGLRVGAHVELVAGTRRVVGRRPAHMGALVAFLKSLRAQGEGGLSHMLAGRRPDRACGRLFLIGDLLDLEPGAALRWHRQGRELFWVQVLAPLELVPTGGAARGAAGDWVEWTDPEGTGRLPVKLDGGNLAAYERGLADQLESWRQTAARHGVSYGMFASDSSFESAVRSTLEP